MTSKYQYICTVMSYEAKHSYFKSFSSRTSFMNVALSLARHHQRWMASNVTSAQENKSFFKIEFECSKKGNRTLRLVVSINFVFNTQKETNVDQIKAVFNDQVDKVTLMMGG